MTKNESFQNRDFRKASRRIIAVVTFIPPKGEPEAESERKLLEAVRSLGHSETVKRYLPIEDEYKSL